ncbi:hypothetical protein YC2023_098653 [Brassica napus]
MSCTSQHRIRRIPINTNLPYLEILAIQLQQLFFLQIRHDLSTFKAVNKVPRKLSYPLKSSRFKKDQILYLEPKSHKRAKVPESGEIYPCLIHCLHLSLTHKGVSEAWNLKRNFTDQKVMNFTSQRFLSLSICEYPTLEGDSSPRKERPEPKPIIGFNRDISDLQQAQYQ